MRTMFICTFSAFLGSVLTFWMSHSVSTLPSAQAQGVLRPRLRVPPNPSAPVRTTPSTTAMGGLTPDEAVNVAVYEKCNRSVVNISTTSVRYVESFLMAIPEKETGNGSGAVLDRSGHILTNFHVVQGAKQIEVTLFNERSYPAEVVGADPVNDIVILKIKAAPEELYPVTFGDSDRLKVGMRVFALGNPFGLDRSMSQGIVSSLNRTLEVQEDWVIKSIIQIDAAINPGNSGGPLLDTQGNMIGMNVAIATRLGERYGQSAGIGFVIPINLIKRILPELIAHGRIIRGEVGITHVTESENGLRVIRMEPGGPAERAGLRGPKVTRQRRGPFVVERIDRSVADVIVAIDGQPVATATEFHSVLEGKRPGDVVTMTILRDGRTINIPITLGGEEPPPQNRRRKSPI